MSRRACLIHKREKNTFRLLYPHRTYDTTQRSNPPSDPQSIVTAPPPKGVNNQSTRHACLDWFAPLSLLALVVPLLSFKPRLKQPLGGESHPRNLVQPKVRSRPIGQERFSNAPPTFDFSG